MVRPDGRVPAKIAIKLPRRTKPGQSVEKNFKDNDQGQQAVQTNGGYADIADPFESTALMGEKEVVS